MEIFLFMHIRDSLRQFIERHIDLIESNNFYDLYYSCPDYPTDSYKGELVDVLYASGIDPLVHMNHIPNNCFYGSKTIKELTLPSSITYIGSYAFAYAKIEKIIINKECKMLNDDAFLDAYHLEEVIFPSDSILQRISEECFGACVSLKTITLPDSIKYIEPRAFAKTSSLEYFSLGKNLGLQSEVFPSSNLTDIHFRGTKEEWLKGRKSPHCLSYSSIEDIICIDGTLNLQELLNGN